MKIEWHRHRPEEPWTYARLDARQREIAQAVRAGGEGVLLLSEVAPVITLGRRTPGSDLLLDREALRARGIEVYEADRGGLATYHGPGQWVLFAVDTLERLTGDTRGVRRAVESLLAIAQAVATAYAPGNQTGASPEIREGAELGVWSARGKVAAVGVHVEQGVLLHGLSLNGYRTPASFVGLRPCGLEPRIDYLLDSPASFASLGEDIARAALSRFTFSQA